MPRLYRNDDVAELMRRDLLMLEMKIRWKMTYREIGAIYDIWHSLLVAYDRCTAGRVNHSDMGQI
jgi:hypothetical protein